MSSSRISFTVVGTPAPQGSKRHVGGGRMIESSPHVKPWRESIRAAALEAMGEDWQQLTGPVGLSLGFYLPRPKGHYGTGRNADSLRPSAPRHPVTKPDLDKLIRAVLDALTSAGLWRDDSQVVSILAGKEYADGVSPRLTVGVDQVAAS